MKPVIIALSGPSNSGKTTTVNLVYYSVMKIEGAFCHGYVELGSGNDFLARIRVNNSEIGILSRSDIFSEFKVELKHLQIRKCDVIVCSTLSEGSASYKHLMVQGNEYLIDGPTRKLKVKPSQIEQSNVDVANQILHKIREHAGLNASQIPRNDSNIVART
jgi:hypothetical protein